MQPLNSKYLREFAWGLRIASTHLNAVWHMNTGNIDDSLKHIDAAIRALHGVRKALVFFKNTSPESRPNDQK